MLAIQSARRKRTLEEDVAASIREFFGANFTRILGELKTQGITHQAVAKVMGVPLSRISTYKDGVIPAPEKLNAFCNKYSVPTEELFIDPAKLESRKAGSKGFEVRLLNAARELLEAAGHQVTKSKH